MPVTPSMRARRGAVRDELVADPAALMAGVEADLASWMMTPDPLGRQQTPEGAQLVEWLVIRWLDLWVEGAATTSADIETVRRAGVLSAEGGLALEQILQAWRLSPRSIIGLLRSSAGHRLETLDILDLTHLILDASDQLAEVFEISYDGGATSRASDTLAARTRLIHDVLAGNQGSQITIEERSAAAGLALPSSPVVLAVVVDQETMAPPSGADLDELAAELDPGSSETAAPVALWTTVYSPPSHHSATGGSANAIGVLLAAETEVGRLTGLITRRRWYAATQRVPSWAGCSHAFKLARTALAAAPHWAMIDRHVLTDADVRVLTMLRERGQDRVAKAAVAGAVLGPLLDPDNTLVLTALEAFLAEGSAPMAARRLRIHPQTLRRRLVQARDLTSRDLQSSWDRFVLDLATTVASSAR